MRREVNFLEMGERLKAVRKVLNLQQKQMAAALKMPASYLSEIESGKGNPGPDFFSKLASKYNISMDYLVLGIGDMFIQARVKVNREEFNLSGVIDSIEKLAWLMDESVFFYNLIMSNANRALLSEEALIKKSIKKRNSPRKNKSKK